MTPQPSTVAIASQREHLVPTDDVLTICPISIVAGILTNILHEGVGHGLTALLTGAKSGVLTTVAWSSIFESLLVESRRGGTLVNLAALLLFWVVLRSAIHASMPMRYFLLITCAYNLFTGTGYFFFSGVTNFGDWAAVISGLQPHWLWRALLDTWSVFIFRRCGGCWYGTGAIRGNPTTPAEALAEVDHRALLLKHSACNRGGLLNPLGMQLLWQSAELSLRTFWTLLRELSSRRRRLPIVLEELSSHSANTAAPTAFWVSARRITEISRQQTGTTPKTEPSIFRTLRPIQRTPTR